MDARLADPIDPLGIARDRVRIAPAPDWITPCSYNLDFRPKVRGPVTHLVIERQMHAERRQTHFHQVDRLETLQAVQLRSQWRLEFEPQTQFLILHSLKVRRGSIETDRLSLERIQFLRREAGLEGCHLDGWITVLVLLEDVIAGDILEWSYTLEDHPRLMSQYSHDFFGLPRGAEVGKHLFSVRYSENRPVKWKSSSPELAPSIATENGLTCCCWSGEAIANPEPEQCLPSWQIDFPWMQISDCPNWETIGHEVAKAWKEEQDGEGLTRLIEEITNSSPDLLVRVNRAIELVQDSFRYLIVDVGLGGQIPASTETIIRRRYGDCKNLAFLLARILRGLGVAARPVLVHALWRKSISQFLPAPSMFNHAIVEYELQGQTRWVDATIQSQGGSALRRFVPDFGLGLPIDPTASGLIPTPKASAPTGEIEFRETFLLDTAGHPSNLAVVIIARGFYADQLRREFESKGVEALAKQRLQSCANRFARAGRIGGLQHRDDRDRNEFMLAEAFEISEVFRKDGIPGTCTFEFSSLATAGSLTKPSVAPRRNPFALPFPCRQTHVIEIEFPGMDPPNPPIYRVSNELFSFSRRSKSLRNYFKMTFSLETFTDSAAPERMDKLRKEVEDIWQASAFRVPLPVGRAKLRRPRDFGLLPAPSGNVPTPVRPLPGAARPAEVPATRPGDDAPLKQSATGVQAPVPEARTEKPVFIDPVAASNSAREYAADREREPARRHRHSRRSGDNRKCVRSLWFMAAGAVSFILVILLVYVNASPGLIGTLFLVAIAAETWAIVLAILGLIECARDPQRYRRGKSLGVITLLVGGSLGCVLVAAFVGSINHIRARNGSARGELLKFAAANFVFTAPSSPWQQVDARRFGPGTLVAFARPGPILFTIAANPLEPGYSDPRARVVELCKSADQRNHTSYRIVSEKESDRVGLNGWEIEAECVLQGHESYFVRWILATNGFGYALTTWSQPNLKDQVHAEAERLCANFQPAFLPTR